MVSERYMRSCSHAPVSKPQSMRPDFNQTEQNKIKNETLRVLEVGIYITQALTHNYFTNTACLDLHVFNLRPMK